MQKNSYRVVSWCAGVLLALGAPACLVTGGDPVEDQAAAANGPAGAQSESTIERSAETPVAENIDPCTALLGCIYTANQNGNDWLVPKCYEVLGPACSAML